MNTILYVEDDTGLRNATQTFLEDLGYHVIPARHGADAWDKLQQGDLPDLILSDRNMPVLDGLQLRQRLLADHDLAPIPFIFLTGDPDASLEKMADAVVNKAGFIRTLPPLLDNYLNPLRRTRQ